MNKKERRLYDFLVANRDRNPNIGEICKACKTTVRTMLGKTLPAVGDKAGWK